MFFTPPPPPPREKLVWNWFVMRTPQVWELSILSQESSTNLYIHEYSTASGAGGKGCPNNGKDCAKMRPTVQYNQGRHELACNTATGFLHFRQKVRKPCTILQVVYVVQWIGKKEFNHNESIRVFGTWLGTIRINWGKSPERLFRYLHFSKRATLRCTRNLCNQVKLRCEASQVWMNATFIPQGQQSLV